MRLPKSAKPRCRIWLEARGTSLLGEGGWTLLDAVRRTGSLNRAAAEMKMSYRAAWGKIKTAEKRLKMKLLEARPVGEGRGSRLTAGGLQLAAVFERFMSRSRRAIDREFKSAFAK